MYVAHQTLEKSFYDAIESFGADPDDNDKMITKYFSSQKGSGTDSSDGANRTQNDNGGDDSGNLLTTLGSLAGEILPEVLPALLL